MSVTLPTGTPRKVTEGDYNHGGAEWAADGETIHAVRYSSDRQSCSLFTTTDASPLREIDPTVEIPLDSILIASEPLGTRVKWNEVPECTYIIAGNDRVEQHPFDVDL